MAVSKEDWDQIEWDALYDREPISTREVSVVPSIEWKVAVPNIYEANDDGK